MRVCCLIQAISLLGVATLTPLLSAQHATSWRDPATGLVWTKQDNGFDVTWKQAESYCRTVGPNWRLGTVAEVMTLWDPTANVNGNHIKGEIQITGNDIWTRSPAPYQGQMRFVLFRNRYWGSDYMGSNNGYRALCVSGFNPGLLTPEADRAAMR